MVLPLPLKHRNPVTSKKKRFHIGVVVIADEAVPWSSLTLLPELGFAPRHLVAFVLSFPGLNINL